MQSLPPPLRVLSDYLILSVPLCLRALAREPAWEAPELALDETANQRKRSVKGEAKSQSLNKVKDNRILVLDADDPFPEDEWPAQAANGC